MQRPVDTRRHITIGASALVLLILVGTVGFALIMDESVFDAFYRTMIVVYTAGLVNPPTTVAAKLFTLLIVVSGVALFFYIFGFLIEVLVSGSITGAWERRRTRRSVDRLNDHYIICGFGRVGQRIGEEFRSAGVPYVVIDYSEVALSAGRERDELLIEGSGAKDENLVAAGIERAKGLVASSDSDADNLYITLSARAMRPDLLIVARASTQEAAKKLELAGADRVVQPYSTAGQEMAKLVLKPQVAAFLEIVSTHGGPDLTFEEIIVRAESGQAGRSIRELRMTPEGGAVIVGLSRRDGTFDTTPSPDVVLQEGDILIAVGTRAELQGLEQLFAAREPVAG
jgi:voltage-gated potassium channel